MRTKSIQIILAISFVVLFINIVKAQPNSQQKTGTSQPPSQILPQSNKSEEKIEELERNLVQLSEKVTALEVREKTFRESRINQLDWIYRVIIAIPIVAGIFIAFLRKAIIAELTEEAGDNINKNIRNINRKLTRVNNSLEEFTTARKIDDLANKQLDLGLDLEQVEELKNLIREAPDLTKDIVFYRARDFLLTKLKEGKFEEIEKASCIFQSIIDGDYNKPEFFRSRAYLSYIFAYHDYYSNSNYSKLKEAKKLINEAIKIRNYLKENNTELYFYEFKRAIYNLHILENNCFPENSEIHKEIARDLKDSHKYSLIDTIKEDIKGEKNNLDFQKRYISNQDIEVLKRWWSKYE